MSYRLVIKNRAEQDLRQQAEYMLQNGNVDAAVNFWRRQKQRFLN